MSQVRVRVSLDHDNTSRDEGALYATGPRDGVSMSVFLFVSAHDGTAARRKRLAALRCAVCEPRRAGLVQQ
jgi:hypothetical protein